MKQLKFNAEMLRLVEAGLKTQTRRPLFHSSREVFPYGKPGDIVRIPGSDFKAKIKDVRVQQLQEISEDDARAEGCAPVVEDGGFVDCGTRKTTFSRIWDSIYAAKGFGWDQNPWVWVIEFETVKP